MSFCCNASVVNRSSYFFLANRVVFTLYIGLQYVIKTSLCSAALLGCKRDAIRICCWAPEPAVGRYLPPADIARKAAAINGTDGHTDGQTDARPLRRPCSAYYVTASVIKTALKICFLCHRRLSLALLFLHGRPNLISHRIYFGTVCRY